MRLLPTLFRRAEAPQLETDFPLTRPSQNYPLRLYDELMRFSAVDGLSLEESFQGVKIIGDSGSGKTSGSGAYFARAFLEKGYGGMVCTYKPDETERWVNYARQTGRERDLVIVHAEGPWKFNFLQYAYSRMGEGAGHTQNAVSAFMQVLESRYRGGKRQSRDDFWQDQTVRLMYYTLEALRAAGEDITMDNLMAMVQSLPVYEGGAVRYRPDSYCEEVLEDAHQPQLTAYFEREWANAGASKQNAGVLGTFTSMSHPFMHGPVRDIFCTDTTFVPEISRLGKIIILHFPVLEWEEVGRVAQLLFKYFWQRCVMRRQGLPRGEVPVFEWIDEAQRFVNDFDRDYQEACRSSWASTVLLTQSINNLYAAMPEGNNNAHANALLGNLGTAIFHRNGDYTTNEWAANAIGKGRITLANGSRQRSGGSTSGISFTDQSGYTRTSKGAGPDEWQTSNNGSVTTSSQLSSNWSDSEGWGEHIDYLVPPVVFTRLAGGGRSAGYKVQGVVFKPGKRWKRTGTTYLDVTFDQRR